MKPAFLTFLSYYINRNIMLCFQFYHDPDIRIGLLYKNIISRWDISVNKIVWVGMGGCIGAVSRYLTVAYAAKLMGERTYPYGTMVVNVTGCFLIGLGLGIAAGRDILSAETRLMIFTGFLGSFTTYSTFAFESFSLAREGGFFASSANIIVHIILGLTAVWAGDFLSRLF